MERFRTTFTLIDEKDPQRRRTLRTEEVIAAVERSLEEESVYPPSCVGFIEDLAEKSGFVCLQHPARARIEAIRSLAKM